MIKLSIMNDEEMLALKKPIIDACVKTAQKNGWSDAMGILRGTLFLENEPMSLDMLAEKTGYSKTTVRSNMSYLENLGMARRVVGPVGMRHRYKQHRYALETDAEAMRPVALSAVREEIHSILEALNQNEIVPVAQQADHLSKSRRMAGPLQIGEASWGSQHHRVTPGFGQTPAVLARMVELEIAAGVLDCSYRVAPSLELNNQFF